MEQKVEQIEHEHESGYGVISIIICINHSKEKRNRNYCAEGFE